MELGNWAFGNSRGEYEVPREWQDDFCGHLRAMGFSGYGSPVEWDDNGAWAPHISDHLDVYCRKITGKDGDTHRKYETDVFVIMPYYWGDADDIAALPNFVYKPTGFSLSWYKYALRDSYMSHDVTYAELDAMLRHCAESIRKETII